MEMNHIIKVNNHLIYIRDTDIEIMDSYKITSTKDMMIYLKEIMSTKLYTIYKYHRKPSSYIAEWKVHNLLYKLHIATNRVKDVNLDRVFTGSLSKYIQKVIYGFVALFYKKYDKLN